MYSFLILLSLLGAKADLNSVLGSGAFNYTLGARVQSNSDHLANLNSVEAVAGQPSYSEEQHHPRGLSDAVYGSDDSYGWFTGTSPTHPSEDHSDNDLEDEFNLDWNNNRNRDFAPKQNCDQTMTTCLSFLNQLTKSIASRNATEIKKHFSESFQYKRCKDLYYLDDVVAKLSGLPSEKGVFAILENQRYYVDEVIAFNATVYGIFARPINSEFVLYKKNGTLFQAEDVDCNVI